MCACLVLDCTATDFNIEYSETGKSLFTKLDAFSIHNCSAFTRYVLYMALLEYTGTSDYFVAVYARLTGQLCVLFTSCRQCVQANSVCGWCVYDHICTGNRSRCRSIEDWRVRSTVTTHAVIDNTPKAITSYR